MNSVNMINENWSKDYPLAENITEVELDDNHSLKKMLRLIGENKRVVDFGCATGYLAQLLNQKGCVVTGVEINPDAAKVAEQHCKEVIVADLDFVSVTKILPEAEFDVAVFGDVLEHLRDPWKVLEETKHILKPSGYVVVSIPNIAHGAIRLALLEGKFEYTNLGILDNTHLRFFTKKTLEKLLESSGYLVEAIERTKLDIFANNDLIPKINKDDFSSDVIRKIEEDKEGDTFQFVLRAVPSTIEGKYTLINKQYCELKKEFQQLECQLYNAQTELEQSQTQLQQIQPELEQSQTQLQQIQPELEQSQTQLQQTQAELEQSQTQLQQTQAELEQSRTQLRLLQMLIAAMESSKFWQARRLWFDLRKIFNLKRGDEFYQSYRDNGALDLANPSQSLELTSRWERIKAKGWEYVLLKLRHEKLPKLQKAILAPELSVTPVDSSIPRSLDNKYQQWLNKHYPKREDLLKMAEQVKELAYKPIISIIVPIYNSPEQFLREAIESVRQQVYPHWELCLADDCSTQLYIKSILEEYARKDSRIKVVFREENGHISRASNSAIAIAEGEFIALLDHDDLLSPHALYEVVMLLNEHPEADMIYSDEDKIDERNLHKDPFFKMDWCPDSFLSRMYTCHLGVYRRSLVNEIGNFRVGFEGSQDYDLVLRFTEKTDKIFHIPQILYHWRIHSQSAASGVEAKPYAYEAAQKALAEALERRREKGKVMPVPGFPGLYQIRYEITKPELVSIIIPTKDLAKTLNKCLESIFAKTIYPHYEVIVVDNGSTEAETFKCFEFWQVQELERFRYYSLNIPFNYSQINNHAAKQAKGKYLLFLNNDTEIVTKDWLDAMVEQAQRPSIGAVGGLLLYPDKTIQHAGVVLGIGGVASHSHRYYPSALPGYFGQVITINNYSAVTAACLMCRREIFEEVNGFEEDLQVHYNDIDFCLKLLQKGYRNIYLPHVVLYHYESKTLGKKYIAQKQALLSKETEYMRNKWQQILDNDLCYNPHLTRNSDDYSINV